MENIDKEFNIGSNEYEDKIRWVYVSLVGFCLFLTLLLTRTEGFSLISNIQFVLFSLATFFFVIFLSRDASILHKVRFTYWDGFALGFIGLGFMSSTWALNSSFALFQAFSWLLLYLFYKCIIRVSFNNKEITILKIFIGLLIIYFLLTLTIYNYDMQFKLIMGGSLNKRIFEGLNLNDNLAYSNLALLIPIVLSISSHNRVYKYGKIIIAILASGIVFLGTSQGAKNFIILVLLLSFIYGLKRLFTFSISLRKGHIIGFGVTCFFAFFGFLKYLDFFTKFEREVKGLDDRYDMWIHTFSMWMESPLVGKGMGNWPAEIYKYGLDDYALNVFVKFPYSHGHNLFVEVLGESGLLGLVLLLGFLFLPLYTFVKSRKFDFNSVMMGTSIIGFALLASLYGVVYFDYDRFNGTVIIFFFCLSLLNTQDTENRTFLFQLKSALLIPVIAVTATWFSYMLFLNYKIEKIRFDTSVPWIDKLELFDDYYSKYYKTHVFFPFRHIKHIFHATIYANHKMYDMSISYLEECLMVDPHNIKYKYEYAYALAELERYDEALIVIEECQAQNLKRKEIAELANFILLFVDSE